MPQAPLEINEFDGGITDNYLDCRANQYQKADNLLVKNNKKFETRYGTTIYDSTMYQTPAGNSRVGAMVLFGDELFYQSGRGLYYQTSSWQTITGAGSNPFFPSNATTDFASFAIWNNHLIASSSSLSWPQKFYLDNNSVYKVRNAGLPSITLTALYELANQIKSKFNAHIASAIHTTAVDSTNQVTSPDAYDPVSLWTLAMELITDYTAHNADANLASAWAYHAAQQSGTKLLTSSTRPNSLSELKTLLDDIKAKYNSHDADATAHSSGSTQQVSKVSAPTLSSAGGSGSTYIYTFVPYYSYYVGTVFYEDYGPTVQATVSNVGTPNTNTITITNIPTIANGTTQNWDTSNIKWKIYRTKDAGTTSYYLKEVTNGTTSTTDTTADASLNTLLQIYTSGGVLDNDPPPPCKFVTVAGDVTWYGYCFEDGQTKKSRIRPSVKFDPDSCPASNGFDIEGELIGLSSAGIYPIAFEKTGRIYRIEGQKDELGTGIIERREIAKNVILASNNSIVQTIDGIYFAALTGFYFTDGSKVIKISDNFNTTYKEIVETSTQYNRIHGKYDGLNNRIYWCVQQDSASSDNDKIYVLDLAWGLRASADGIVDSAEATFTTHTPSTHSWSPCCLALDTDGTLVVADRRGYIFKFDANKFSDPRINTATNPSTWYEAAITWDYRGPAFNAGTNNLKKQSAWLTVVLENQSNISLEISSQVDNSGLFFAMDEIRKRGNVVWGDVDAPSWQSTDPFTWQYFPLIIEKRRFGSQPMRYMYRQIRMTNSDTVIIRSDDYGTGTVATGVMTISAGVDLPSDLADYTIAFEDDSYATQYSITAWTSTTVTFTDNQTLAPQGAGQKWVIKGTRKNERLNLIAYSLNYELLSDSHRPFRGDTSGNA